jgi:flagellin-like hook-associated protein FlgL
MLSATAPIFGNLATATSRALSGLQRSVGRTLRSGDAVASLRDAGDGGQFSYAARMEGHTRSKNAMLQGMQNAVTYVQMQEAGLLHAHQLYDRMSVLAVRASNPMLSDSERQFLSVEFESLKQDSLDMNNDTFQGRYLYDDIAASVKADINFGEGFNETSVTGDIEGLTVGDITGSLDYDKFYELEKEVYYNSGIFTLEVNGGGNGERYMLKQGATVLFDTTSKWATTSNAYRNDFDRFVIDYSPGQPTTFEFVPLDTGNGKDTRSFSGTDPSDPSTYSGPNGRYDNRSRYLSNLNLTNDGPASGMETREGTKYTNQGQIATQPATGETTKLTLRVERDSIFQINASYSTPKTSSNYITVGDAENGYAVLDPVGLGLLQNMSISTVSDAVSAVDKVAKEIEGLGTQIATIGASLSELQLATERMSQQVAAGQRGLSRMTDGKMAEESVQLAKERMRTESNLSLMTQARGLRKNLYGVLME